MDAEVLTTVDQLLEEVSQIRQLGKRWGFGEEEINACISEALDPNKSQMTKPENVKKGFGGKLRTLACYAGVTWLLFLSLIFTGFIVLSFVDDKTQLQISKPFISLAYPVLRYSRLLFLPLHNVANITDYYSSECLIENPWFDEALDSCWHCDHKKKLRNFTENSSATWREDIEVAIFKNSLKQDVDFKSFQQMILNNQDVLGAGISILKFESNVSGINSPTDLIGESVTEEMIQHSDGFHVLWHSSHLAVNRIVRQFFGRPQFVPTNTEVAFEKTVIVEGPGTKPYTLISQSFPSVWYTQAIGTRNIRVLPNVHCREQCKSFETTLQPKDTVVFMDVGWQIQLLPLETKEVSVGYIGCFN